VNTSVQLDNQTPLGTAKIDDVQTHCVLATKFEAPESESPQ
jgi:hypothetical protein